MLVRFAKIDSFIATLGVGTVAYGLAGWYTGGEQIIGDIPAGFVALDSTRVLGIPLPAVLLLVLAGVMWVAFEFLPVGRYLYVIGANERTAELTGIRVNRYVIGAFCVSGCHRGPRLAAARRPHPGRPEQCGAGVPAARLRRRAAGRDHGAARAGSTSGAPWSRC